MSVVESIKSVAELAKRVSELELRNELGTKLAEAVTDLLTMQAEVAGLREENARLQQELRTYKDPADLVKGLQFKRDVYWPSQADLIQGPAYCPACLHQRGKRMPLQHIGGGTTHAGCPSCKVRFNDTFDQDPTVTEDPRAGRPSSDQRGGDYLPYT